MKLFGNIKRLPVSKEIFLQIKESILSGKIKSGEKIPSERELTERFNVSRNMVREAIRALEISGYLEIHQGPYGGAFVTEFTPERLSSGFLDYYFADKLTVSDLNQARLFLEPEVARLAATNTDPHSAALFRQALEKETYKDDFNERCRSMTAVHLILAGMCGNYFYEIMVNSLIRITIEIISSSFNHGNVLLHGPGRHDKIVQEVLANNPEGAARAMSEHLKEFAENLVELDKTYKKKP